MLSRKAILIMLGLVLVMLAGDIWQVTHGVRWSTALFCPPIVVVCVVVSFVERERVTVASADALAAWKKWGSVFGISIAVMSTVGQLLPVVPSLGIPLPSSELIYRLLLAGCGLAIITVSNRAPKLPPLLPRWPGARALGAVDQLAVSRFLGWQLVTFGMTITLCAFLPWRAMGLLVASAGLATLAMTFVKRYQVIASKFRGEAGSGQ
jgi:hypothetical protein